MERSQLIHIAAEVAVVGSLAVYLLNENSSLKKRVEQLEKDIQVVARQQALSQKRTVASVQAAINASREVPQNTQPKPQQPPKRRGRRKVRFEPHLISVSEDSDEDLLTSEFGYDDYDESCSSSYDESYDESVQERSR